MKVGSYALYSSVSTDVVAPKSVAHLYPKVLVCTTDATDVVACRAVLTRRPELGRLEDDLQD